MAESRPHDPRVRFGLAVEYERAGRWEEAVGQLRSYLSITEDEGNAFGRLARALTRLGQTSEARDAYRRGIEAALRHNHPSLASELEEELDEL
jgi:Flp pilus assembly protein TadD